MQARRAQSADIRSLLQNYSIKKTGGDMILSIKKRCELCDFWFNGECHKCEPCLCDASVDLEDSKNQLHFGVEQSKKK